MTLPKLNYKMESIPVKAKIRKLTIRWIQIRIPIGVKNDKIKYYFAKFWGGKEQEKVKTYLEKKLGKDNVKWIREKLKMEIESDVVAMHDSESYQRMVEDLFLRI